MDAGVNPTPPRISIVTPVLNAAGSVERCLDSVEALRPLAIEHHVIDGGSTDGTLEILERRAASGDGFLTYVSEPDQGIADAFNKGILRSRGDWIGILNADDWYEPDGVRALAEGMTREVVLHAKMRLHNPTTGRSRETNQRGYRLDKHFKPLERMPAQHPTCFVPRSVYERVGLFNVGFKLAMDYEFLLRVHLAGVPFEYRDEVVANYAVTGASARNPYASMREVLAAQIMHRGEVYAPVKLYAMAVIKKVRRRLFRRKAKVV